MVCILLELQSMEDSWKSCLEKSFKQQTYFNYKEKNLIPDFFKNLSKEQLAIQQNHGIVLMAIVARYNYKRSSFHPFSTIHSYID